MLRYRLKYALAVGALTLVAGLALAGSSGCGVCVAMDSASVRLTVIDDLAHCPEEVFASFGGGGEDEKGSGTLTKHGNECSATFDVGFGISGDLIVHVETKDGSRNANVEVDVGTDSCGTDTEEATVTLK